MLEIQILYFNAIFAQSSSMVFFKLILLSCPASLVQTPTIANHFLEATFESNPNLYFFPTSKDGWLKVLAWIHTHAFLPRQVNLDNPCTILFQWHQLDHQSVHQGCRSPISFSLHVKHRFGDIILVNIHPWQIPK